MERVSAADARLDMKLKAKENKATDCSREAELGRQGDGTARDLDREARPVVPRNVVAQASSPPWLDFPTPL